MSQHELLFSRKPSVGFTRHLVFWLLIFLLGILSFPPNGSFGSAKGLVADGFWLYYRMALVRTTFHLLCQLLFCYPLLYWLVPAFFHQKKYWSFAITILLLALSVTLLRIPTYYFAYNVLVRHLGLRENSLSECIKISYVQYFDGPAFFGLVFITLKMLKDWYQKQQDNLMLRRENAEAELQLLKSQVQPHFLFNTLNNIYSFALSRSPQAKVTVKKLEEMLRYMIQECEAPQVLVQQEIKLIRDYVELQRIRYGNHFDLKLHVSGDFAGRRISPLLMIPLVENSFKHGASRMLHSPWIELTIRTSGDRMQFSVVNSKPPPMGTNSKKGIGIKNVRKRLELLYPEAHSLVIIPTEDQFAVQLEIPMDRCATGA